MGVYSKSMNQYNRDILDNLWESGNTVETVVLLSKVKSDKHINMAEYG